MTRRLKKSKLDAEPCVEDIDFRHPRGLDRPFMRSLITSQWVAQHLSALFTGPTGIGKSWLAQALAQKACRDGYTVLYRPAPKLFRDLIMARADGSLGRVLESIARTDVLVVDDFAMAPLSEQERRDFLEICDDRYSRRSTILTSQLPVKNWHAQIGDPTLADSILDRLVHNAYRIELSGESIRKKKGRGSSEQHQEVTHEHIPAWFSNSPPGGLRPGGRWREALALLSDRAFKLYIHLCLDADRHTGRAVIDPALNLARVLGRAQTLIEVHLDEFHSREVCERRRNRSKSATDSGRIKNGWRQRRMIGKTAYRAAGTGGLSGAGMCAFGVHSSR